MELTLGVAVLAGVISFLSPCVLPVVPAYLGQLGATLGATATATVGVGSPMLVGVAGATPVVMDAGRVRTRGWRSLPGAVAFVLGFTAVFTLVGMAATAAASPLRDNLPILRQLGGVLLIVLGLNLMGILRIQTFARSWRPLDRWVSFRGRPRHGVAGGLVLGSVFAVGWTPCIGPTLGAVLTMAALTPGPQAVTLLVAYSIGLGISFLILAMVLDRAPAVTRPLLRRARSIEIVGGALVVLMGFALLFDWLRLIASTFRAWWPQV